jgi:hypothetical protein
MSVGADLHLALLLRSSWCSSSSLVWVATEDGRKFDKFDPASPRFREKKIRLSVINRSQNDETQMKNDSQWTIM